MAAATRTRLIVGAAVLTVLAVAGVRAVQAADPSSLPSITADRLLASTVKALSEPVVISGEAETFADFGLPQIPSELGGEAGLLAMVNGTQRFRVWHSADGVRIAHVLQVSERDLVVNREEAWWWDSSTQEAVRLRFADVRAALEATPGAGRWMSGSETAGAEMAANADPLAASRAAIEALAPYASVTVEGTREVAGRSVYRLVLRPATGGTLVDSIVLAIDAESRLPIRVEIVSRSTGAAAFSSGFTSLSFDPIDASVFAFSPPQGADVIDALDASRGSGPPFAGSQDAEGSHPGPSPMTFGTGFATRIAIPVDAQLPGEVGQVLPYSGPLLSATFVRTDGGQGWVLVGSVPLDVLQADAARLP